MDWRTKFGRDPSSYRSSYANRCLITKLFIPGLRFRNIQALPSPADLSPGCPNGPLAPLCATSSSSPQKGCPRHGFGSGSVYGHLFVSFSLANLIFSFSLYSFYFILFHSTSFFDFSRQILATRRAERGALESKSTI